METQMYKVGVMVMGGIVSYFAPIRVLVIVSLSFIMIDFITGVIADRKRTIKRGKRWRFRSDKAWNTIWKIIGVIIGISLSYMIDHSVIPQWEMCLPNIFCCIVCFFEFWSWLENIGELSNHPMFRHIQKFAKNTIEDKLHIDIDDEDK